MNLIAPKAFQSLEFAYFNHNKLKIWEDQEEVSLLLLPFSKVSNKHA